MSQLAWRRPSLPGLLLLVLVTAEPLACVGSGNRGPEPRRPDHVTTPTTIGVLTSYESADCVPGRFHLDGGVIVDLPLGNCESTVHVRQMFKGVMFRAMGPRSGDPWPHGPLMLFGSDDQGQWYAVAEDERGDGSCYVAWGGAYREGDALHFPSGLLLPLAPTFKVEPDYIKEPFPLRDGDEMCLDRRGHVMSASVFLGS